MLAVSALQVWSESKVVSGHCCGGGTASWEAATAFDSGDGCGGGTASWEAAAAFDSDDGCGGGTASWEAAAATLSCCCCSGGGAAGRRNTGTSLGEAKSALKPSNTAAKLEDAFPALQRGRRRGTGGGGAAALGETKSARNSSYTVANEINLLPGIVQAAGVRGGLVPT